jgi:hypothetical protein
MYASLSYGTAASIHLYGPIYELLGYCTMQFPLQRSHSLEGGWEVRELCVGTDLEG